MDYFWNNLIAVNNSCSHLAYAKDIHIGGHFKLTPAHSYATNIEPDGNIFIRRGRSWWHEDKNCRVSRRYESHHAKRTSGLGLRVVIRKNVE